MAIITEEPEEQDPKLSQNKPTKQSKPLKPNSSPSSSTKNPKSHTPNPFTFWFYFTLSVSLVTLLFISISSLSTQDPKSWFLSLPNSLRQHYSKGRTIKVQTRPNQSPIEVFTIEHGPVVSENVVIIHGLGTSSYSFREVVRSLGSKGVHVIAIDLPGNGFSDKSTEEVVEGQNGALGRFWYVYNEIQEKGLFWAFDQIVETGQIPYEEIQARMSKRKIFKPIELGPEEMGRVLGQVIGTMGVTPVHLVLHDSALGLSANWVSENSDLVRSITLIDTASTASGALPLWILDVPVVRDLVLGFSFVYARMLNLCCSKGSGVLDADAQRVLLKGRDGRKAVVSIGKNMNYSFNIAEWGASDGLKAKPMQVLWSAGWSKEWREEGYQVANALPQAAFVTHSGGRWPQEDVAVELAENISRFVSSLPKSVREVEEESIPEHIQKMFDEAQSNGHDHHHHHDGHNDHHHDGHAHVQGTGYTDAYGLGHGWES
ncbi:protein AUXIN RESPONSE 4 [Quillaja saponaria]|uniref:Protein AUXIN RESPONSE 4 n=1 Tax=Quillaja saponaria TaxID=32244 RepID=A0AAD7Q226_QUISA|nr:protein AUXIN RESPONSE 4 [Quillaja saponaria]